MLHINYFSKNILGVINTELSRHIYSRVPKFLHPMIKCSSWCIKTPFHGAQTTLYCCLEDKIEHESGNYYSDCAQKPASPQGQDAEAAKKLWELSEKMVGLKNE